jgi:hypothetical protein
MIDDVLYTSLEASASDTKGTGDEVYTSALVFLPPNANFAAQTSLSSEAFFILTDNVANAPVGSARAFIYRYINGGFESIWLNNWPSFVKGQNGYAVQFGLFVGAFYGGQVADSTAAVFIES